MNQKEIKGRLNRIQIETAELSNLLYEADQGMALEKVDDAWLKLNQAYHIVCEQKKEDENQIKLAL